VHHKVLHGNVSRGNATRQLRQWRRVMRCGIIRQRIVWSQAYSASQLRVNGMRLTAVHLGLTICIAVVWIMQNLPYLVYLVLFSCTWRSITETRSNARSQKLAQIIFANGLYLDICITITNVNARSCIGLVYRMMWLSEIIWPVSKVVLRGIVS